MAAQDGLKILYVSDSLGTPIHARGIFNYSVSLVEILKKIGAEITLVVEQAPGYGLDPSIEQRFQKYSPDAIESSRLAEIYRYFYEKIFAFNFRYQTKIFRFLAEKTPPLARAAQKFEEIFITKQPGPLENRLDLIDYIPTKAEHLTLFDKLLFLRRFYSSSMTRAGNGMDAIALDASGYDLVLIDTPHNVRVKRIRGNRIITVVHDLIPLRDFSTNGEWKLFYFRKVEAALDQPFALAGRPLARARELCG